MCVFERSANSRERRRPIEHQYLAVAEVLDLSRRPDSGQQVYYQTPQRSEWEWARGLDAPIELVRAEVLAGRVCRTEFVSVRKDGAHLYTAWRRDLKPGTEPKLSPASLEWAEVTWWVRNAPSAQFDEEPTRTTVGSRQVRAAPSVGAVDGQAEAQGTES